MSELARSSDSLLLGNGQQLELATAETDELPAAAFARQESRGIFTADRLYSQNPRLYRAIAKLLGRSETFGTIADLLSVSVNTIRAVREREAVAIDTEKTRIGAVALDVARLSFETLHERLADPDQRKLMTAKELAVVAGIATQNAQLLLGGPTSRIESVSSGAPGHDDYMRLVAMAKNVTGTGYPAETPAANAGAAALPEPAGRTAIDLPATAAQATPTPPTEPAV